MKLPKCIDPVIWSDWCDHLVEAGKPLTSKAAERQLIQLEKWGIGGENPNGLIELALESNWKKLIKPENYGGCNGNHKQRQTTAQKTQQRLLNKVLEQYGTGTG